MPAKNLSDLTAHFDCSRDVCIRQYHAKLIPAEPCYKVCRTIRRFFRHIRDLLQASVAAQVAVRVVPLLQRVGIHQEQRNGSFKACRQAPLTGQTFVKSSPVGYSRQRIHHCQFFERLVCPVEQILAVLSFCNVPYETQNTRGNTGSPIPVHSQNRLNPDVITVSFLRAVLDDGFFSAMAQPLNRIVDFLAIIRVRMLREFLMDQFLRFPPFHGLDCGEYVGPAPIKISKQDHIP